MRILVTDGHYKQSLGIVRALAPTHQVLVCAPRRLAMATVSRFTVRRLLAPAPSDAKAFVAWLDRTIPRYAVDQIIPVGALSCDLLSHHADRWPATRIVLPTPEQMSKALDKRVMLALAAELGIATPRFRQPTSKQEVSRAGEDVGFPLVIKAPVEGAAGVAYVDHPGDLAAEVARYQEQYHTGEMPLLQQRIEGPGIGVFVTYQRGRAKRLMVHRRIREFPPTGGESTCCELAHDAEALRIGRTLLDALQWHGAAMVELKRNDSDGLLYLMEVNPKFWGSLDLALAAGADFPGDLIRIGAGEELPDLPEPSGQLRYCWPLGNDLRHLVARPGEARSILADWFGAARSNIRWSDPLPHVVELAGTIGRMLRR